MHAAALGFGYWTARLAVPVLSFGRMRVERPHERLVHDKSGKIVLEKGGSAVFGAFLFAALVTGAAVLMIGRPL